MCRCINRLYSDLSFITALVLKSSSLHFAFTKFTTFAYNYCTSFWSKAPLCCYNNLLLLNWWVNLSLNLVFRNNKFGLVLLLVLINCILSAHRVALQIYKLVIRVSNDYWSFTLLLFNIFGIRPLQVYLITWAFWLCNYLLVYIKIVNYVCHICDFVFGWVRLYL